MGAHLLWRYTYKPINSSIPIFSSSLILNPLQEHERVLDHRFSLFRVIQSFTHISTSQKVSAKSSLQIPQHSLLKRATKLLSQISPNHPPLIMGVSIYRGFLGYSILYRVSRATLKLGVVELFKKTSRATDWSKVTPILKNAFAQIKASESHLLQTHSQGKNQVNATESIKAANCTWSIGLSDGLRDHSRTNISAEFAVEQRLSGMSIMELGLSFGVDITANLSILDARRMLGNVIPIGDAEFQEQKCSRLIFWFLNRD